MLLLFGFLYQSNAAIKIPEQPNPPRLVNDFAGLLQSNENDLLEKKLEDFVDSTSNRIVVVIVNSLEGNEPVDYATELGRQWKIGAVSKNNGIVLLISKSEHKIFIAVGTGLQGALTDGICALIIQHEMRPAFKQEQYYKGINDGISAIMLATKGEYKADAKQDNGGGRFPIIIVIIIVVVLIILMSGRGGNNNGTMIGGGGFNSFLLGAMLGNGLGGGGGFGSGRSSGGGGFGGFGGGGGFDGGGAGGSW